MGAEGVRRLRIAPEGFYGFAGEIVRAIEPHTEADPNGLLVTILAEFGAHVGRGPHAVADGAEHPPRLFPVLVGETSRARKGTAQANIDLVFDKAFPNFRKEHRLTGLASGEGLIQAASDLKDRRFLIVEPELARVLQVCNRDTSTLSAIIRQTWDGGDLAVMTRQNPLRADDVHVVLISHITKGELRQVLSGMDAMNGFANRFLFCEVRRSKRLPEGGGFSDKDLASLARELKKTVAAASVVGRLQRTPEAKELWAEYYNAMDDKVAGLFGAVTARAEAQLLRLSVSFALLDAGVNSSNSSNSYITSDHLRAAKAVWDYCEASAKSIFRDATGIPLADQLLEHLAKAGTKGLTFTQLHAEFHRNVNSSKLHSTRLELEKLGRIRTTKEKGSAGAPVYTSYYVPEK